MSISYTDKLKFNLTKPSTYERFIDLLNTFYGTTNICPTCNKKGLTRSSDAETGTLKLVCKLCGWRATITLPTRVNIYKVIGDKIEKKRNILGAINPANVKEKQEEYKVVKKELANLGELVEMIKKEKMNFEQEKLALFTRLSKLYLQRSKIYDAIQNKGITKVVREKLIEVIKNEKGSVAEKRLKELYQLHSKELPKTVSYDDYSNYYNWLVVCREYIQMSMAYDGLYKSAQTNITNLNDILINFTVIEPKVVEQSAKKGGLISNGKSLYVVPSPQSQISQTPQQQPQQETKQQIVIDTLPPIAQRKEQVHAAKVIKLDGGNTNSNTNNNTNSNTDNNTDSNMNSNTNSNTNGSYNPEIKMIKITVPTDDIKYGRKRRN